MVSMAVYGAALSAAAAGTMVAAGACARLVAPAAAHAAAAAGVHPDEGVVALTAGGLAIAVVNVAGIGQGNAQMSAGVWLACAGLTLLCTTVFAAIGASSAIWFPVRTRCRSSARASRSSRSSAACYPLTERQHGLLAEWTPMSAWPRSAEAADRRLHYGRPQRRRLAGSSCAGDGLADREGHRQGLNCAPELSVNPVKRQVAGARDGRAGPGPRACPRAVRGPGSRLSGCSSWPTRCSRRGTTATSCVAVLGIVCVLAFAAVYLALWSRFRARRRAPGPRDAGPSRESSTSGCWHCCRWPRCCW